MDINAYALPLLVQSARDIFHETIELIKKRDPSDIRTTAILTVTDQVMSGQPPIIVTILGEIIGDSDKLNSWNTNSREKAERLCQNSDHVSAWESRDFDDKKYGGAIKTPTGEILSMSGLPEFGDEACCLVIAMEMGWIDEVKAQEIVNISGNDLFDELYARWQKI
jgi:hypothetical protein